MQDFYNTLITLKLKPGKLGALGAPTVELLVCRVPIPNVSPVFGISGLSASIGFTAKR